MTQKKTDSTIDEIHQIRREISDPIDDGHGWTPKGSCGHVQQSLKRRGLQWGTT